MALQLPFPAFLATLLAFPLLPHAIPHPADLAPRAEPTGVEIVQGYPTIIFYSPTSPDWQDCSDEEGKTVRESTTAQVLNYMYELSEPYPVASKLQSTLAEGLQVTFWTSADVYNHSRFERDHDVDCQAQIDVLDKPSGTDCNAPEPTNGGVPIKCFMLETECVTGVCKT